MNVLGTVLLLLSAGFCGAGFFSPNWIDLDIDEQQLQNDPKSITDFFQKAGKLVNQVVGMVVEGASTGRIVLHQGLLARCFIDVLPPLAGSTMSTRCQWFWMDGFEMETGLPNWHYASQGLYVVGYLLIGLSLLLPCCCRFCSADTSSLSTTIGALSIVASLLLIGCLAVFGTFQYREGGIRLPAEVDPEGTLGSLGAGRGRFAWGSYLVIVAIITGIVAAIMLLCSGRKRRLYSRGDDYETARMIRVNN